MTSAAQAFAALQKLTPTEAVDYLARRNQITPTYGWQDMWQQEHARAFTVSRLTRADLMQSLQEQISKSVGGDMSRRDFMRDAKKLLSDAGWWGEKEVIDPATGEVLKTTFDPARLKLIFDTNTSMAYAAGQWERIQSTKRTHPYLRYVSLADDRVRPAHRAWNGVTLPVDDAFWQTHFPPNGWRCRCRAVAVSQRDYDKGRTPTGDPMKKTAPDVVMRDWLDKRSGQVRQVPVGIDPGFGYNPGMARARASAQQAMVEDKLAKLSPELAQSLADLAMMGTVEKTFSAPDAVDFFRGLVSGERPIAVAPTDIKKFIGSSSDVILLSKETAEKQYREHPEMSVEDYRRIQAMLDSGEVLSDKGLHLGIIQDQGNWYYAVLKTTKTGKAIYLLSFRRSNPVDIGVIRDRSKVVRPAK